MSTVVDADERLERIERLAPHPGLPMMWEVVAEIAREAESYIEALDRFAADGRGEEGLRLAVRLAPYWNAHGLFAEGRARLLALLEAAEQIPPSLRAQALERIGTMAFEQGANEEARSLFEESLAAARGARDEVAEAAAYGGLARCALMAGDLDIARRRARACEQIHRDRGDERALDYPLHILAYADYIAGDDARARVGFEETLELNRRLGNRRAVARELTNLGSVETRAGNLERAQQLCEQALRLALEIANPLLVTYCVINMAGVASARGEHERAALLLGAGEAMMEAAAMTLNPGTAIEHERHVERTRSALGEVEYERVVRAGRELDRGAAIEHALRTDHVSFDTERLVMRKYTHDDAAFVFDMYSRWEVQRLLAPNSKPMETMDEAVQAIERWRRVGADNPLLGVWAVTTRDDGNPVGTVMFKMAPLAWDITPLPLSDDYEIVWHLHPEQWGRGYATEASAAVLRRAFAAGVPEVIAIIRKQNEPSKSVARRLGMDYVGETDRYYSMTAGLWRTTAEA